MSGEVSSVGAIEVTSPEEVRVSHLKLAEAISFALQLRARVESEWQRVITVHAALIGVMIFFAEQAEDHVAARSVVFGFYSFNVLVSWINLRDDYAGLAEVHRDLLLYPKPALGGHSLAWLAARPFSNEARIRLLLLLVVWLLVFYLMIIPLVAEWAPA